MLELWKTVERRPATPRAGESAGVLCTTREATQGVSCELALPRLYGDAALVAAWEDGA